MEFQINDNDIKNEFSRIANLLLLQKELIVNNTKFNFTEIEFYYYNDEYQDVYTHEHYEIAGKWRFHNQGFDITLRGNAGYGGVLIRGVEHECIFTNGPRRVLFTIMKQLNSVNEINNKFGLQNKEKENTEVFSTFRHGLNNPVSNKKCANLEKYKTSNCRFIVKPLSFDKKQFSDSERIAKSFNDSDLSLKFLGYVLK